MAFHNGSRPSREDAKLIGGKGYLGISYHLKGLLDFHVEIDIPR